MSRFSWADHIASYLAEKTGAPQEKQQVMAYALEVLGLNVVNLLGTLMLAWVLGVLKVTLAIVAMAFIFRRTAGGGHSSSPYCCAVVTIIVFPGLALLARTLSFNAPWTGAVLVPASITIGLLAVSLKAPVETLSAPIISPQRKKRLKKYSILVMMLITAILILLSFTNRIWAADVRLGLALATLWISFNLTAAAGKLWQFVDTAGEFVKRRWS